MHAYAQMKVHADPQAQAMAEIINAGEEEVREGGDTPNMVDAEYQTEYQTGHEPAAAEAVAQMEIDLQGVDGGVSDGGAEGDMAEVAREEGAVSEDSFEFTDHSSSVIEENDAPALALMTMWQGLPGMHGQPDETTMQPDASGAPPQQQQQQQQDHGPAPAPQVVPSMHVLPPLQEAQAYETEAQRQHDAAAALWQQQQQQLQEYRRCELPECQRWCPWNSTTGEFYAHCSQDHQWRCAQEWQQQPAQPHAGPPHPMPPSAMPPMPQPMQQYAGPQHPMPPPAAPSMPQPQQFLAGMMPPQQQPPPPQPEGGMPPPMPLMQQPPPPQPAAAQLPARPTYDPSRAWQGHPSRARPRSPGLPLQPPQPAHSAPEARQAEGTPARTSIDPELLGQIPDGLSPSFLRDLGLEALPESLEVNVYQMIIFVPADTLYCRILGYADSQTLIDNTAMVYETMMGCAQEHPQPITVLPLTIDIKERDAGLRPFVVCLVTWEAVHKDAVVAAWGPVVHSEADYDVEMESEAGDEEPR
jgi:hypothetical protein